MSMAPEVRHSERSGSADGSGPFGASTSAVVFEGSHLSHLPSYYRFKYEMT